MKFSINLFVHAGIHTSTNISLVVDVYVVGEGRILTHHYNNLREGSKKKQTPLGQSPYGCCCKRKGSQTQRWTGLGVEDGGVGSKVDERL